MLLRNDIISKNNVIILFSIFYDSAMFLSIKLRQKFSLNWPGEQHPSLTTVLVVRWQTLEDVHFLRLSNMHNTLWSGRPLQLKLYSSQTNASLPSMRVQRRSKAFETERERPDLWQFHNCAIFGLPGLPPRLWEYPGVGASTVPHQLAAHP